MTDEADRLWEMRQSALKMGDVNFAREIELRMIQLGIPPRGDAHLDDTPAMKERAVSHRTPAKRNR